ncbi:MAG: FAD-binding oxidoreductase [Thaumarchaeota archaeon]|nr:FAD-binding oxidoreductase [Nitrososphaerota archaeon]
MPPRGILDELKEIVGSKNVLSDTKALRSYTDGSLDENRGSTSRWRVGTSYGARFVPDLAVMPSSTEEVAAVVQVCNRRGVPLIPLSGGSNLVGATVPIKGGVVVDMRRMNRVLKIDESNLYAICQPAVILSDLQTELGLHGLCHGTNPGSADWATVGGAVSIGAQTMTGFRYGTIVDNLLELEVVLPYGDIVKTGPWYGSGYNLRGIFPRSEGTLGIITQVTMRVHRLPPYRVSAGFMFDSFEAAVRTQLELSSLELHPLSTILSSDTFGREHEELAREDPKRQSRGWLILELEGEKTEVSRTSRRIDRVAGAREGRKISRRSMDSIGDFLLIFTTGARKSALPALHTAKVRVSRHIWVPPDKIVEVYRAFEDLVEKYGMDDPTALNTPTRLIVGCLVDPKSERDITALAGFLEDLRMVARDVGGTLFGAHGAGLVNKSEIEEDYGEGAIELMKRIKLALDPRLIMNPGKVLDLDNSETPPE